MREAVKRVGDALGPQGVLRHFMSFKQRAALMHALLGEEGDGFADLICALVKRIELMPLPYETDGQGDSAIVHLHYFAGGQANWWIVERDSEREQHQAFGWANLFGGFYDAECGYISIQEIIENGGELDLYWEPKPVKDCK